MKDIKELLQDADPLRHEPTFRLGRYDSYRQAVLAEASATGVPAGVGARSRVAIFATVSLTMVAASFLGSRVWSVFVGDLQAAAVRFEVRFAEYGPTSGLREAKVLGSNRPLYLHNEVIVTNSDIAAVRVVPGLGPSEYGVGVEFKPSGAEKMRSATGNSVGKLLAILLDGQVVMALVLRSPIGASAVITGNFTRPQAERIVKGLQIR